MNRASRVLLTIMVVTILTGCAAFDAPAVTVRSAEMVESSADAMRLDVRLELENLGPDPIELKQFTYVVALDGHSRFSGTRAAQATLASGSRTEVVLPAIVRYEDTGWTPGNRPYESSWAIDGSLLYLTPGALAEILLDTRFREPRAAFHGGGSVAIQ